MRRKATQPSRLQGALSGQILDISLEPLSRRPMCPWSQYLRGNPVPSWEASALFLKLPTLASTPPPPGRGLIWHPRTPPAIARQMLRPRHLCRASLPPGGEATQLQAGALEGVQAHLGGELPHSPPASAHCLPSANRRRLCCSLLEEFPGAEKQKAGVRSGSRTEAGSQGPGLRTGACERR